MTTDFFYNTFNEKLDESAIIYKDKEITYKHLIQNISYWKAILLRKGIKCIGNLRILFGSGKTCYFYNL